MLTRVRFRRQASLYIAEVILPRLAMILRSTPDRPKRGWPYLPWMSVIDAHFKLFGFEPGDRVYLDINHKTRQITITPDYSDLVPREQAA
ncbi:hypothetical protein [Burkholderia ubonensis]|uniref:hypothetical protein n=1 Tax=Burkholderia ubonensis TaxID=101571 RepID=UPI001E624C14|nr:hypothetical protein [Burkholderia ubonensis]